MKKLISVFLIVSQFSVAAMASGTPSDTGASAAPAETPEVTLLESVLALQGQNLPTQEKISESQALFSNYLAKADPAQAQSRLESAMVTLGLYTPAQAQTFAANAQAAAERVAAAGTDAQSSAVSSEIASLASQVPAGAEFSSCTLTGVVMYSAIGSAAVALGALLSTSGTETCPPDNCGVSPEPATEIAYIAGGVFVAAWIVALIADSVGDFGC